MRWGQGWVQEPGWFRQRWLCGVDRRRHVQYPAFTPNTQLFSPVFSDVAVGFFLAFLHLFLPIIYCSCMQLSLVPYSFFVLCYQRRSLSSCKHCHIFSKESQSQPVSYLVCLPRWTRLPISLLGCPLWCPDVVNMFLSHLFSSNSWLDTVLQVKIIQKKEKEEEGEKQEEE